MTRDDFLELSNPGFAVHDNNEPVPDNIPVPTTVDVISGTDIDINSIAAGYWGFGVVYQWRNMAVEFFLPPN